MGGAAGATRSIAFSIRATRDLSLACICRLVPERVRAQLGTVFAEVLVEFTRIHPVWDVTEKHDTDRHQPGPPHMLNSRRCLSRYLGGLLAHRGNPNGFEYV